MALKSKSLFLYGQSIDVTNQNLDFVAVLGGPTLTAVIDLGQYSLTTLLSAIQLAMANADTTSGNIYTVVADRTVMGGTQNRITISSTGAYFSLLFGTGPNNGTSIAELIGFNETDYTGLMNYTGSQSSGTVLIPEFIGYNFRDQKHQAKLQGASNISAAGIKETVVFNEMYFIDVEFKHETGSDDNLLAWQNLRDWMIIQAPFDFTPEISNPTYFSPVTLEKSEYDSKGMGFQMKEELPDLPNLWGTGPLNFRVVLNYFETVFITG